MLRFKQMMPFRDAMIMDRAISTAIEEIEKYIYTPGEDVFNEGDDDGEDDDSDNAYQFLLPDASRLYSPRLSLAILDDMKSHIWDDQTYYLYDYHYLLLFDVLSYFDLYFSTMMEDIGMGKFEPTPDPSFSKFGREHLASIDIDQFIDDYFWDATFLFTDSEQEDFPPLTDRMTINFSLEALKALRFRMSDDVSSTYEHFILKPYSCHG